MKPTAMNLIGRFVFICALWAMVAGCGASFDIETPPEMVAVEHGSNKYVGMTHEGVVVRVNVYSQGEGSRDVPQGSHEFWLASTRERMRTTGGYALLDEKEVQSSDGHGGTRLEFGRDQDGVPYRYWITLYVTDDNIHVIDAGGRQDRFENAQDAVERALKSYVVER